MHHLKRIIKAIFYTLTGFIGLVLIYLLFAVILSTIPVNRHPKRKPEVLIYLLTNGVHTDIAVPVKNRQKDWGQLLPIPDTSFKYLALGWGDKNFYISTPTWAQLKLSVALKAATGLSESALHATFYRQLKERPACVGINISREQYSKLVIYLENSFARDSSSHITRITTAAGMYRPQEMFFNATRRYTIFYTCNTWTNNALKTCEQKACLWTPFDKGTFYHYGN